MKVKFVGMWALVMAIGFGANAQDEFSDEDLTKYATVMKWAEDEKGKMSAEISDAVNNNEILSGANYKKLKAAQKVGDLSTAEVSEEEVAEFQRIQASTDQLKSDFKVTYTDKIKTEIGAGLYNNLRKALKTDADLKARYDAILNGLGAETEEAEGTN